MDIAAKIKRCGLAGLVLAVAGGVCLPATAATAAGTSPKLVKQTMPKYPKGAQELQIEGWVELEFNVDGSGNVVAPHVVSASPPGIFDAAALRALAKWKYQALGTETDDLQIKVRFKQR
jgi:protein TonB